MIVVDSCVAIAWLGVEDAHHDSAERLLLDHAGSDFVVHPLTLAEILVGPAKAGRAERALESLSGSGFRADVPDAGQPVRLAELRADTGLKLPDCCALDVALAHHAPLATFDDRLASVAEARDLQVLPTP